MLEADGHVTDTSKCVCVCVCARVYVHLTAQVERQRSARAPDHRGADVLVISQHWLGDDELIAKKIF